MDDMTGFRLASGNSGVEIKGYGFPLSLDEEKDRSLADLFAGIECLTGTIESQNVGRLAIKYDVHTGSDIERDSIMEGYSGTGLFSLETDGICYRGLVSCSRGDKTAGYTMWATDAGKITELMKENNIEIECPESFEPYGKLVADEFSEYKKNSKRIWNGATYKLIKNQGISPKDFEVQTRSVFLCAGERKLCDEFWKGKLKELVVMKEIQEVACEELINPIMQLPSRCGGKDVVLKFLCTEYKAEYILGKMIEDEIMKNVTYHLNFNEKDEPQLFIEVCEGEESSKEVYRPETYFSTAQLNTVAFSSFFGRALSTNNLPVKTICIDDPIGHFDDMNILGFTDMVRCILEKQDCQIIMSTHEEKVYQIMKRKLDPNFYNTLFIQLDNSEKVIWNRANC